MTFKLQRTANEYAAKCRIDRRPEQQKYTLSRHTEFCKADRTTLKSTLQDINMTPKEPKTEHLPSGPAQGKGLWGGRSPLPPFWKRNWIKLRNTHFLIKGIFDGIRILDRQTSPKHLNLWLVRFDPLSLNDYLYKTTLSCRLLRFHQSGDVVYAQTIESFLIKFLKSPRGCDFLKQKWNSMTS